jgi:hypothetical protein
VSGNPSSGSSSGGGGSISEAGAFSGGIGGQEGGGVDRCIITIETTLASPVPTEVATLTVGEILALVLEEAPPAVVAVRPSGARVGAITQRAADFSRCIQDGYAYSAEVLSINGGAVTVLISNRL